MPKSGQSNRRAACPCRLKLDWDPSALFRGRMLRIVIFLILLLMASAYALWKGGGPERVMATILLGMLVVDQLVHLLIPAQFASVDTAHLVLDLIAALLTFMLAMTAHRLWPMVAAVLQTLPLQIGRTP